MRTALFLLAVGIGSAQTYTFSQVDPPGSTSAYAAAINNAGKILGEYSDSSGAHCFLRDPDGTFTSYDPPGTNGNCAGLNNLGQTVGTFFQSGAPYGYIRSADGGITTFPLTASFSLPGAAASGINDRGEVVGTFAGPPYGGPAFIRLAAGVIVKFQEYSVGQVTPESINNNGDIAGWTLIGSSQGTQHGFVRGADGTVRRVDLPGTISYTRIASINNLGQVAGAMVGGPGFVSNADGSFTILRGYSVSGLNDHGAIVGSSLYPDPDHFSYDGKTMHAFLGTPGPGSSQPEIRTELPGVLPASAFGGQIRNAASTIRAGTWIEIYGRNLAPTTRQWWSSDFAGDRAPTSIEGVSVSIGGVPCYVSYISPGQVNALLPSSVAAGTASVVVNNGSAASAPYYVTVAVSQPAMLALQPDEDPLSRWAVALFPDFVTYALPPFQYFSNVSTRQAKAGDTLIFMGEGFGPVSPAVPDGHVASEAAATIAHVEFTFNRVAGRVVYAGVVPRIRWPLPIQRGGARYSRSGLRFGERHGGRPKHRISAFSLDGHHEVTHQRARSIHHSVWEQKHLGYAELRG